MNEANNSTEKQPFLKGAALLSFIGLIILIAWLSVKLVNVLPEAFSSLASTAESIREDMPAENSGEIKTLLVTSNTTLINSGDNIVISWSTSKQNGSYTFAYTCTEGASLSIIDDGERALDCETNYNIGNNDSLTVKAESEKSRYENIDYTISFLETSDESPSATGNASFTIINSEIDSLVINEETSEEELATGETIEESEEIGEEDNTTNQGEITFEQEFTYEIPTSNPNGNTDLGVRFIDTGRISGNRFIADDIEVNDEGAIQFEVKNYGTKTSEDWTFKVSLPTGGYYESPLQDPLKPNERAVLTIGFTTSSDDDHTFEVEVEEDTDLNTRNDEFTQRVNFVE